MKGDGDMTIHTNEERCHVNSSVTKNQRSTQVPRGTSERIVTRTFMGGQSLHEILKSLFQNRVDNIIYQMHEYTQANSVTSPTVQTERAELS